MSLTIPSPTKLTYEQMDEIAEMTGVDLTDMANLPKGKLFAAIATWARVQNGENVNFETVYKAGTLGDLVSADEGESDPLDQPAG